MRIRIHASSVKLWLSSRDTYEWARREGHVWPCSQISGTPLFVEFDKNGLCDIRAQSFNLSIESNELTAICADFLKSRLPESHPAYLVAVGQFDDGRIVPV